MAQQGNGKYEMKILSGGGVFKPITEGDITNNIDISHNINKMIRSAFPDQEGVLLDLNNFGQFLTCTMFFRAEGGAGNVVFNDAMDKNMSTMSRRVLEHNLKLQPKKYRLSDELRDCLSKYIIIPYGGNKKGPDWNKVEVEVSEPSGYDARLVKHYIKVSNISVSRLLKDFYDNIRNKNVEVLASVIKQISQGVYLTKIDIIDNDRLNELVSKIGFTQTASGIPMIR